MRTGLKIAGVLLVGGALGLASAGNRLSDNRALENGPWRIWPARVIPAASPYTLAHHLRHGRLPADASQSVIFTAANDSDGDALRASCDYLISGPMPPVRWWSLGVESGSAPLTSGRVVLGPDGTFQARMSRFAMPGNWLRSPDRGRFRVTFALFGPGGSLKDRPEKTELPQIRKDGDCQ